MKKSNPTTLKKKPAKIPENDLHDTDRKESKVSLWLEDYRECFSFKMKPVTEGFIDRLINELDQWSQEESSVILRDFYDARKIPSDAFYRWAKKYENLGEAVSVARGRIASRREKGGMTRKFDPGFILQSMPIYDPMWKEFMQWKSTLKQNEEKQEKIVIEINDLSKKIDVKTENK